jgi:hypothetical protein
MVDAQILTRSMYILLCSDMLPVRVYLLNVPCQLVAPAKRCSTIRPSLDRCCADNVQWRCRKRQSLFSSAPKISPTSTLSSHPVSPDAEDLMRTGAPNRAGDATFGGAFSPSCSPLPPTSSGLANAKFPGNASRSPSIPTFSPGRAFHRPLTVFDCLSGSL